MANPTDVSAVALPRWEDFYADGYSDVLMMAGSNPVILSNTTGLSAGVSQVNLLAVSAGWSIAGVGHYTDTPAGEEILWQNSSTGEVGFYSFDNPSTQPNIPTWHSLGVVDPTSGWHIVDTHGGHSDFNGLGDSAGRPLDDILWQNSNTGEVGYWQVVSNAPVWTSFGIGPSSSWVIRGTGDFDDGNTAIGVRTDDILWQSTATGEVGIWRVSGAVDSTSHLATLDWRSMGVVSSNWSIQGVGNFDGGLYDDILWRGNAQASPGASSGDVGYWSGDTWFPSSTQPVQPTWTHVVNLNTSSAIVGTGDYTNDGYSDILIRTPNATAGQPDDLDYLSHTNWTTAVHFADPQAGWTIFS